MQRFEQQIRNMNPFYDFRVKKRKTFRFFGDCLDSLLFLWVNDVIYYIDTEKKKICFFCLEKERASV